MKRHVLPAGFSLLLVFGLIPTRTLAAPPTAELLQRLPEQTNAVLVIQVQEILKTPRAVREGWGAQDHMEFLAGAIPVHPSVEKVVIGSQFDPFNPGKSWYIGLVPTKKPVSMEKLAERYKGTIEEIGGDQAVFSPQIGYIVRLSDELIATLGSNDRQSVSRWIRFAKTNQKPSLPFYVRTAISKHPTAHVLMVVDTDDLINPKGVRVALLRSNLFTDNDKLLATADKFLSRLHGVRFVAQIGDQIKAKFYFDSAVEATKDLEVLKPFFMDVLGRIGAELEDLRTATVATDDRSVILEFNLADSELAKIMALMSSPMVNPSPDEAATLKLSPDGVDVGASQRYYRAVNQIVDDLKKQNKRATDYMKTALWHETAARKIGQLSVLHVDKDVLAYGADVGMRLKSIADSLRGVPIKVDDLENQKFLWAFGSGWGWGGTSVSTNVPEVQLRQIGIIRKDEENRTTLWNQIDNERGSIRSKMADRYKIDFDAAPNKR